MDIKQSKRTADWWITGHEPPIGPYSTRAMAVEALRDIKRFYRNETSQQRKENAMVTEAVLEITRDEAVKLMNDLGYGTAEKWSPRRMYAKIIALPQELDGDVEIESQELLEKVLKALKDGDVELVGAKPETEKPAKTKKEKPSTEESENAESSVEEPPKKKRGRPRKNLVDESTTNVDKSTTDESSTKKKRGRPRKNLTNKLTVKTKSSNSNTKQAIFDAFSKLPTEDQIQQCLAENSQERLVLQRILKLVKANS